EADPKAADRYAVFAAWKSLGVGKEHARRTPDLIEATDTRPDLRKALLDVAAQRFGVDPKIDPKALGKWLGQYENTIAAGCKRRPRRSVSSQMVSGMGIKTGLINVGSVG